jgi:uncharacterized protein (DUF3820 family)
MVPALTDKSLMLLGKYQGYELANVPAQYLLWIYDNLQLREDLIKYIDANRKGLEAEVKRANKERNR